jgi:hypothetical protein
MFKYVAMIAGLLIMCVPEEAGMLRFVLQGGFGLCLFGLGVLLSLEEANA